VKRIWRSSDIQVRLGRNLERCGCSVYLPFGRYINIANLDQHFVATGADAKVLHPWVQKNLRKMRGFRKSLIIGAGGRNPIDLR
jgi:hypothetical protein